MQSHRPSHLRPAGIAASLFLLLLAGTLQGAWTPSSQAAAPPRQIGIPTVPVFFNGFHSTPEAIQRHSGQDLHYVIDGKALHVFLSPEQRDAFLQSRWSARVTEFDSKSTAGPTATFWEHENRTGQVKQYSTSVFSLGAWSDVISSLETGTRSVRLWEHEGFRGASLTIPADVIVEDLRPFGWSDVASSIQFL
jgi:hypothetical protein